MQSHVASARHWPCPEHGRVLFGPRLAGHSSLQSLAHQVRSKVRGEDQQRKEISKASIGPQQELHLQSDPRKPLKQTHEPRGIGKLCKGGQPFRVCRWTPPSYITSSKFCDSSRESGRFSITVEKAMLRVIYIASYLKARAMFVTHSNIVHKARAVHADARQKHSRFSFARHFHSN